MCSPYANNCHANCHAYTLDCVPFYCDVRDLQEWKCFMISKFWPPDGPRCHCCGRVKCKNRGLLHKLCVVPGITGRTMYDILTKTEPNFKACECEDVWSTWSGPAIPFTNFGNTVTKAMKGAESSEQRMRQRGMDGFERQSVSMLPNDPIWLQNFSDFYRQVTGHDGGRVNKGFKTTEPIAANNQHGANETRKHIYAWLKQLENFEKQQKHKAHSSGWRRRSSRERRRSTRSSLLHHHRRHTRTPLSFETGQPNFEVNDPRTSEYIVGQTLPPGRRLSPTFRRNIQRLLDEMRERLRQQAAEKGEPPIALLYHQPYRKENIEEERERRLSPFLNSLIDTANQYDSDGVLLTDLNLNPKRGRRRTPLTLEDLDAIEARFLSIIPRDNNLFIDR